MKGKTDFLGPALHNLITFSFTVIRITLISGKTSTALTKIPGSATGWRMVFRHNIQRYILSYSCAMNSMVVI